MKTTSGHSLIWYTVVVSVGFHLILLFLAPGFISGSSHTYTLRDLTFLVEEVIRVQEKPSQESEPGIKQEITPSKEESSPDEPALKPVPEVEETDPVSRSGEIAPVFDKKLAQERIVPKPETAKDKPASSADRSGLTLEEAQAKLKELEGEIGNLSDEERLARIQKERKYLDVVREQLQQRYFVPRTAKHQGMKGEVMLEMTIHRTGRLIDVKILRHSDFPILDMAAKSTVEAAAPFPNIADKVDFPHLSIIVTFQYK